MRATIITDAGDNVEVTGLPEFTVPDEFQAALTMLRDAFVDILDDHHIQVHLYDD